MAIDFFEQQEKARKSTTVLVVLFAIAVFCIIALTYLAVAFFVVAMGYDVGRGAERGGITFDPFLLGAVSLGVLLIVGLGSAWKISMLSSGGRAVAESLGGKLVDPGSRDPDERRLLNVVEEMAVASGTPVPRVYVMENERAINAFAAGWSPEDAVVGMTRGAIETLDRDELQGVVAHEFSHILNGDMRLNIRLMGILHGILVIGLAGLTIMRTIGLSGRAASRSSNRGGGNGGAAILAILALGAALAVIGFVGMFFGRLIKAAVSRQREYLADASAVQFTRNPEGIGNALVKIGAATGRAKLEAPNASEASHMFFGEAITNWFGGLSTHPPLEERIRRVMPSWDGTFPKSLRRSRADEVRDATRRGGASRDPRRGVEDLANVLRRTGLPVGIPGTGVGLPQGGAAVGAGAVALGLTEADAMTAREPDFAAAAALIASIDPLVREQAHETFGARAVIIGLLLSRRPQVRDEQLASLERSGDRDLLTLVRRLETPILSIDPQARLAALELCMPALRSMAKGQWETFRRLLESLVAFEQPPSVFGWVMRRLVIQHLDRHFGLARNPAVHHYALRRLGPELSTLLSFLAHAGHREADSGRAAFAAGAARVGLDASALRPPASIDSAALDAALDRLAELAPKLKRTVLEACAAIIAADLAAEPNEIEILRAVADTLDVPAPPWQPGDRFARGGAGL